MIARLKRIKNTVRAEAKYFYGKYLRRDFSGDRDRNLAIAVGWVPSVGKRVLDEGKVRVMRLIGGALRNGNCRK